MRKYSFLFLSILVAFPSLSQSNNYKEMIKNEGFEEGTTSLPEGWYFDVWQPSKVRWELSGFRSKRSISIECLAKNNPNIFQEVSVVPGKTYTLSLMYKCSNISPGCYVELQFTPKKRIRYQLQPKNTGWRQFIQTFKAESDKLTVSLFVNQSNLKVWFDNVRITKTYPHILNSNFEELDMNGALPAHWVPVYEKGISFFKSSSDYAHRGKRSASISCKNNTVGWLRTRITDFVPDNDFEIHGYYKIIGDRNSKAFVKIEFLDVDDKPLKHHKGVFFQFSGYKNNTWENFSKIIYVPKETVVILINLGFMSIDGSIYWDDISMKKVEYNDI